MMKMNSKSIIRNGIIGAVILIAAIAGYKIFFANKSASSSSGSLQTTAGAGSAGSADATTDGVSAAAPAVGQDFLSSLLSVQSINLDDSIFSSQAFTVLQDFNRPIPPDTNPGRANPFAPVGSDSASLLSSQVSTSNASSIAATSSTLNGTLTAAGQSINRWFEYGTSPNLGTMTPPMAQANPGVFAAQITGLLPNTTYYAKAVALINNVSVSGNTVQWTTAQK